MSHNIVKRGPRDFYCTVCHQQWVSESKAYCPGLPVRSPSETLLTKNQLSAKGYSVTDKALPKPVACYRGYDDYVMLYDPAHATPKRASTRPRATYYLETIWWPRAMLLFLEQYVALTDGPDKGYHDEMIARQREISDFAIHLGCFSETEGKAITDDDGVLLTLAPAMTVHKRYQAQGLWDERQKLAARIIEAYRHWRWQPKPMDAAVAEFRRMEREKNRRMEREEMAARFAIERANQPKRLIEEDCTPVKQRAMFDDAGSSASQKEGQKKK